jgi:hypothetical protein
MVAAAAHHWTWADAALPDKQELVDGLPNNVTGDQVHLSIVLESIIERLPASPAPCKLSRLAASSSSVVVTLSQERQGRHHHKEEVVQRPQIHSTMCDSTGAAWQTHGGPVTSPLQKFNSSQGFGLRTCRFEGQEASLYSDDCKVVTCRSRPGVGAGSIQAWGAISVQAHLHVTTGAQWTVCCFHCCSDKMLI